jgi:hypothetical protein
MNADPKTAAYYVGVSQHAFDVPAPSTLVKGVALAYAIVALGLAANLVFSDGTPGWAAQDPVARATNPAIDPDTLTVGYRLGDNSDNGSGYLEFVPPPSDPDGTVGLLHAPADAGTGE